jgi:lipopolysaccharide/colanic/teichoic acid biosynthesis glycosyltransferase
VNYPDFWKRVFDLILSLIMFLVLLPVFLLILIVLSLYFKGSPFFFQERPGKKGQLFKIIKFKTMNPAISESGQLLSDEKRITKLGKILRKTSLDEIPQLINVFKGEMSLVGPRPLLTEYLTIYNSQEEKRHLVKPGVTGWAQINGRNEISWQQKFQFDIWYVDNISFSLDLRILFETVWNVLRGKGVSQPGHVTVGKFTRNLND